jgi:hypothetical protein
MNTLSKNNMEKETKLAIGIIIAGLLVGVGVWLSGTKEEMITIPLATTQDTFKEDFMSGCTEEGTYENCNCYYNSLVNRLGKEGLVNLSLNYMQTEQISADVFTKVYSDCIK